MSNISLNPMSQNDYDAITWLETRSAEFPALNKAWQVLRKYYDECCEVLQKLDTHESPFENENERSKYYSFVERELIPNEEFMAEVEELLGISRNDVSRIIENKDYTVESEWYIAKTIRLYNMHLKLGHSARITYVAEQGLSGFPDGNNSEIVNRTVLLSALLHDVGRFYQSVNYNTLDDGVMRDNEEAIAEIVDGKRQGDMKVDHAIAGYYYSLASALELHKLEKNETEEDILRYITEAVAAVVVRYHQKNNGDIKYFDFDKSSNVIHNPYLISEVYKFINSSYDNAVLMNYDIDKELDYDHKMFIEEFVKKIGAILYDRELDFSKASGFDYNQAYVDTLHVELGEGIKNILQSMHGKNADEVSNQIVELVNQKVIKLTKEELTEAEKESYREEIKNNIKKMLNFDVAAAINDTFRNEESKAMVDSSVHCLLSSALAMTMDADKIDILNQRALGIYNVSYYLSSLSVFPTENMSLRDILNNQFHFNLPSDGFELNDKTLKVVRSFYNNGIDNEAKKKEYNTMKQMLSDSLGEFDIFDTKKFPKGTSIKVYSDKVVINGVEYPGNQLYNFFGEDFITYITQNTNYSGKDFKDFKKKYCETLRITIDRDAFEDNIANYDDKAKRDAFKHLLVSDGLTERFKKEGINKPGNIWINAVDNKDTDHILRSSVTGLIWQMNQFLMVNMRRRHSFEFIEKYKILELIKKQYEENDPMIASILNEYIDYSMKFIEQVLADAKDEAITSEFLEETRNKVSSSSDQKEETFVM